MEEGTMTTKVWGKPGAWAQDAEENEALEAAEFPSLAASAASKPKKKNKHQTLSLSEFTTGTHIGPGGKARSGHHAESSSKGLTPDEMLMLPTGPRQRNPQDPDHPGSTLGGGFRGYGMQARDRDPNNRDFGRSSSSSRREGFDGEEPSRADSSDHWGSAKAFHSDDRRAGGGGGGGFASKADEADDWSAGKKSGAGFESYREADARDRWAKRGSDGRDSRGGRAGFDFFQREGGPDGDRWARREENSGGGGGGGGGRALERPRLVLQPRTSPNSNGEDAPAGGPRAKATNPFGEARPREEVLAEKGQDWKKIDEELLGSHGWKVSDGTGSLADRPGEAPGARGNGGWRCNSPADGRSEGDWRKKDAADNGQSPRLEESVRAVNGKESLTDDYVYVEEPRRPLNGSDVNELMQTDKGLEQLTNDIGHKVHVSHRSDVGSDRTARW